MTRHKNSRKKKSARKWAKALAIPARPLAVIANIAYDDRGRGDTAGRVGLARTIARFMGATYLYADEELLAKKYPLINGKDRKKTYDRRFQKLVKDSGVAPQIVLGSNAGIEGLTAMGHKSISCISAFNESMSSHYCSENRLVAHHLTPEIMTEAGNHFDTLYPGIKRPLIAVMMASPSENNAFLNNLQDIARTYPEATIFLCGCHRTSSDTIESADSTLKEIIKQHNRADTIDVITYRYEKDDSANPYRGLIARADHFVVWGDSHSLISEALYSGKSIHIVSSYEDDKLRNRGYATPFATAAKQGRFSTKAITPPDTTGDVAQAIINEHIKKPEAALARDNFLTTEQKNALTTEERSWLRQIMYDARALTRIPAALNNRNFIRAALAVNGTALEYVTAAGRRDPELVAIAIRQSADSAAFADPALMNDPIFLRRIIKHVPLNDMHRFYRHMAPRLQHSLSFAAHVVATHKILRIIPPHLIERLARSRKQDHRLQFVLHTDTSNLPRKLRADKDLMARAFMYRPMLYPHLSLPQQRDRANIAHYFSNFYADVAKIGAAALDDAITMRNIISHRTEESARYMSDRLKGDVDFFLSLPEKKLYAIKFANDSVTDNIRVMARAISMNSLLFSHASPRLRQNRALCLFAIKKVNTFDFLTLWSTLDRDLRHDPRFIASAMRLRKPLSPQFDECIQDLKPEQRVTLTRFIAKDFSCNALPSAIWRDIDLVAVYAAHCREEHRAEADKRIKLLRRERDESQQDLDTITRAASSSYRDHKKFKDIIGDSQWKEKHFTYPAHKLYEDMPPPKTLSEIFKKIYEDKKDYPPLGFKPLIYKP